MNQYSPLPSTSPATRRSVLLLPSQSPSAVPVETGGDWIVNVIADDVPPPGEGFTMVTCAVPEVATSAAPMSALSTLLLMNVVVRATPFQWIVAPVTKPLPLTVSLGLPGFS